MVFQGFEAAARRFGLALAAMACVLPVAACSAEPTSEVGITTECVRRWNMSFSDVSKDAEYVLVEAIYEDGYSSCSVIVPLSETECVAYNGALNAQFDKMTYRCEIPTLPMPRVRELAVNEFGDVLFDEEDAAQGQ